MAPIDLQPGPDTARGGGTGRLPPADHFGPADSPHRWTSPRSWALADPAAAVAPGVDQPARTLLPQRTGGAVVEVDAPENPQTSTLKRSFEPDRLTSSRSRQDGLPGAAVADEPLFRRRSPGWLLVEGCVYSR